jgi:hypothetical protein
MHPSCNATLAPGATYWWSVQATLSDGSSGAVTPWMSPRRFSIGLQGRSDWSPSASFIGLPSTVQRGAPRGYSGGDCPWLRTSFDVTASDLAAVRAGTSVALLHVASFGFHEAYANGRRLDNTSILIPSASLLAKRVLSHTYDVAFDDLVAGTNQLGIWASAGWASLNGGGANMNVTDKPLVMAELRITPQHHPPAAPTLTVVTTAAWTASASNMAHLGQWDWGNYGGESLDHSRDEPDWATTVRSAGWANATVFDADVAGRLVTPEHIESVGVVETIAAVSVEPCAAKPTPKPTPPPPPPAPPQPNSNCPASSGLLGGVRSECGAGNSCGPADRLNLTCASGVITAIDFASWGTATGECGAFKSGACNSTEAFAVAAAACAGKPSCSLLPERSVWEKQDPCYKVAKRLSVQASGCTPKPQPQPQQQPLQPAPEAPAAPSCFRVKMAKLFNGWLDVSALPAAPGSTVTLQYSGHEHAAEEWNAMDTVKLAAAAAAGGSSDTGFSNRFNWHEFQYVTVTGLDTAPELGTFVGKRIRNKVPRVGTFR